jgi:hypothetical protein
MRKVLMDVQKPYEMISDFITGGQVPNVGAEENRQAVERYLVENKGFAKTEVEVGAPIEFDVAGETYQSQIDLIVSVNGVRMMLIKCAAGSIFSCEREVLAAARILEADYQVPYAIVADGSNALIVDTLAGSKKAEGMAAIPDKKELLLAYDLLPKESLTERRRHKEQLIFRTYNMEYVNIGRRLNNP